jgi:hypothetical protein
MATDWNAVAQSNPYVAKALTQVSRNNFASVSEYDAAVSDAANSLAQADQKTFTQSQANTPAVPGYVPHAPPKAANRLATTAPTTALRTYGAFLGGTGAGGSSDPLLGSDSSGTARGRLLG